MGEPFLPDRRIDRIIDGEVDRLPSPFREFVFRKSDKPGRAQWKYFAYGYFHAFEELAEKALERWPSGDYLGFPLFFVARHSIELAMKATTVELAEHNGSQVHLEGHRLDELWAQLLDEGGKAGFGTDDEYTYHCGDVVAHLHAFDPTGERFRYPAAKSGLPFIGADLDLEGLVRGHWLLTTYCDAISTMLSERN
jgi:hypothetical protein